MIRMAGVDLPKLKRIDLALTKIYGLGRTSAQQILDKVDVDASTPAGDLDNDQINQIRAEIDASYTVEGDLRRSIGFNIKRLIDLGNYRGIRHRRGLPVHGQRTKTNARTRKGPRKTVAGKKK
ncbi:MAG: 30S ribosomal protein S13 [Proteobacteria bacterium]|nr:30S ribosomal protein S13 [Pseudomonadota bacterium]